MREGDKTPLKERFEAAAKEFATTFSRKARMARAGLRPYPSREVRDDLCAAASSHGLFAAALWAYFWAPYASLRGENDPLRPRGTGGVGAIRIKRVLRVVVAASLLAVGVLGYGLHQPLKYEATAKVLVGRDQAEQNDCNHQICPIPNAPNTILQTFTQTVAQTLPTKPVARAVVEQLNLPKGSAAKVRENTRVKTDPGTALIDITYRDSEPKRAQQIANAIGRVAVQRVSGVSLGERRITASLWEPATYPQNPVSPKPLRNAAIALGAGLVLGWAWTIVAPRLGLPPAGRYSPECVEKKSNSPKFTVASDPSSVAVSTLRRHIATPSASNRGD
jgi:capsular polysaccharide biosynthesis protein